MVHLLDNIFWHALTGPQAHRAVGSGGARRYAPGFSPIVGFANPQRPDFSHPPRIGRAHHPAGLNGMA